MTNPVGYSVAGPPQGLKECGTSHGGYPDWIGDGLDNVAVGSDKFFYVQPLGGPFITPPCSASPMKAIFVGGAVDGDYVPVPMNAFVGASGVSSIAAEACATSSCQYVEIRLNIQITAEAGKVFCNEDVTDPQDISTFDLSMEGFGAVTYQGDTYVVGDNADFGVANENIVAPNVTNAGTSQYNVTSTLLRPTALTWPGQDPDNLANRNIWLASEVGGISWSTEAYAHQVDVAFGVTVHGRALATDYPVACPIIPVIVPTGLTVVMVD